MLDVERVIYKKERPNSPYVDAAERLLFGSERYTRDDRARSSSLQMLVSFISHLRGEDQTHKEHLSLARTIRYNNLIVDNFAALAARAERISSEDGEEFLNDSPLYVVQRFPRLVISAGPQRELAVDLSRVKDARVDAWIYPYLHLEDLGTTRMEKNFFIRSAGILSNPEDVASHSDLGKIPSIEDQQNFLLVYDFLARNL